MFYAKSFHIWEYEINIVISESAHLVALLFNASPTYRYFTTHHTLQPIPSHGSPIQRSYEDIVQKIYQRIQEYSEGKRRSVLPPSEIAAFITRSSATTFEKNVWHALLQIPYGTVTTYGHIARLLGMPRAARAVGNSLAKNTLPILIPCHRVVLQCNYNKKNHTARKVKNYSGGVEIKEKLLRMENSLGM